MRDLPLPISMGLNGGRTTKAHFTEQIAETIQRQCQLVRTQFPEDQVTTLWLSGEGNRLIDMEQLETLLGWQVKTFNPVQTLTIPTDVLKKMSEPASYWSTAVGLALRGLDDEK